MTRTEDHTGQCVTCDFWDADRQSDDVSSQGICRAHAPVVVYVGTDRLVADLPVETHWPWTCGADWCGEWRVRK